MRTATRLGLVLAALCVAAPDASAQARAERPGQAGAGAPGVATQSVLPDTVIEARTTAIASQLRCPVCQGLSIQDSPSDLSQEMRGLVRDQVAAGKSDDEIRAYFVSKYGEWILLSPRPRGFNLLAYALPFALLVGGGAVIVFAVRRWAAAPEPADAGAAPSDVVPSEVVPSEVAGGTTARAE